VKDCCLDTVVLNRFVAHALIMMLHVWFYSNIVSILITLFLKNIDISSLHRSENISGELELCVSDLHCCSLRLVKFK
jgi:hypothetical protein